MHVRLAERVTTYNKNGNKINTTEPPKEVENKLTDIQVWKFIPSGSNYKLQSLDSEKYLGKGTNLTTSGTAADWTVSVNNGKFKIVLSNGNEGVYYSTGSQTFSLNTNPSDLEFYQKVTMGSEIKYIKVTQVQANDLCIC